MRKFLVLAASLMVIGAFTAATPAAWADHGVDELVVIGEITDFEKTDNGEEGLSEDDEFAIAYDLFDEDGEEVGAGDGSCVLTKVEKKSKDKHSHSAQDHGKGHGHDHPSFEADCEAIFELDDGDIEVAGTVTDEDFKDGSIVLDITGGSGDFDDAEGEVEIEPLDGHGHGHGRGHSHSAAGHDGGKDGGKHKGDHKFKATFTFE
jgi:hypothetical protein